MIEYRDFIIDHPLAGPTYGFIGTHVDYDGREDDRCFTGKTIDEVKAEIDRWCEHDAAVVLSRSHPAPLYGDLKL